MATIWASEYANGVTVGTFPKTPDGITALAKWVQAVGPGVLTLTCEGGATFVRHCLGGEVYPGSFTALTGNTCTYAVMGNGPPPPVAPSTGSAITSASLGPVIAVAVANQATLSGLAQTVDGVALSTAGMRVALWKQTTGAQNGLWVVQTGNWTRPADWASGAAIPLGTQVQIAPGGTANFQRYGSVWYVDSGAVVDTDTILAYPVEQKGQGALVSGSPSTLTISNLWIKSATLSNALASNVTTPADGLGVVMTAGAGTGTLVVTGPNTVTDTFNWRVLNG